MFIYNVNNTYLGSRVQCYCIVPSVCKTFYPPQIYIAAVFFSNFEQQIYRFVHVIEKNCVIRTILIIAQFNVRIVEAIAIRVSPYCGKQQLVPII